MLSSSFVGWCTTQMQLSTKNLKTLSTSWDVCLFRLGRDWVLGQASGPQPRQVWSWFGAHRKGLNVLICSPSNLQHWTGKKYLLHSETDGESVRFVPCMVRMHWVGPGGVQGAPGAVSCLWLSAKSSPGFPNTLWILWTSCMRRELLCPSGVQAESLLLPLTNLVSDLGKVFS